MTAEEEYDINDILGLEDEDHELTMADVLGPRVSTGDLVIPHTQLQARWMFYYLNPDNPVTFLQASAAARAAGYSGSGGQSGMENRRRFSAYISLWVDAEGLSPAALRQRLTNLVHSPSAMVSLPALKMAMQSQGLLVDRKVIEGGDKPISHTHNLVLPPEIQAKLMEIYLG